MCGNEYEGEDITLCNDCLHQKQKDDAMVQQQWDDENLPESDRQCGRS